MEKGWVEISTICQSDVRQCENLEMDPAVVDQTNLFGCELVVGEDGIH